MHQLTSVNAVKLSSDKESVKIDLEVTKEVLDKASKGGARQGPA